MENGRPIGVDRLLRILSGFGLSMIVTTKEMASQFDPARPDVASTSD
ncbi:protein of unknown function [Pararobbsia alpina]